jgi:hypothetical protein
MRRPFNQEVSTRGFIVHDVTAPGRTPWLILQMFKRGAAQAAPCREVSFCGPAAAQMTTFGHRHHLVVASQKQSAPYFPTEDRPFRGVRGRKPK